MTKLETWTLADEPCLICGDAKDDAARAAFHDYCSDCTATIYARFAYEGALGFAPEG